jgi:hypothetical protein
MGNATSKVNRKCSNTGQALLALAFVGLLSACGAGGGEREFDSATSGSGASTSVARVDLKKSSPSITSDARQVVQLYATVKSDANVALAGIPVSFSASGTGVTLAVSQPTTDANGQVSAQLSLDDPENRSVTVRVNANGVGASTTIEVVGTTTAISGPSSIAVNSPGTYQVVVKDASGAPVAGKSVQLTSAAGSSVSMATSQTDAQGRVEVVVTPTKTGSDTLTASAAGATGVLALQVSSTSIAFTAPADHAEIVVGSTTQVSSLLLDFGNPVGSARVSFGATRGSFTPSAALTGVDGVAFSNIVSPYAGTSMLTATAPNGSVASRSVLFVGGPSNKLELQAWPSNLGVTLPGSTPDTSQIIAIVRDRADNPVKGVRVDFSASDPSNGIGLSQAYAISDEFGRASVSFYPGPQPTGTNQVTVAAQTVRCTDITTGTVTRDLTREECASASLAMAALPMLTDQTSLTVGRRALQVRIGTGNETAQLDAVYNEVPYAVLVTDSAGNPARGVTLNASVVSLNYRAGNWIPIPDCADGEPCWQLIGPTCTGEDVNRNLRLDPGEDRNSDGMLTPGSVATAYFSDSSGVAQGTTDANGSATLQVRYLRDRSARVSVVLRVSASVPDGTEGAASASFVLPMLSSDVTDKAVAPPGALGAEVGYGTSCP